MAKPREVELSCEEPFAAAAARVLAVRTDELLEHSEGVLDTARIERLHAMRVATRRLRAAMEVFEACFPRKRFRRALKEVKAIADALGERRDRDVAIEALEGFAQALAAERGGLDALLTRTRSEQTLANDRLTPFLDKRRLEALAARIDELVTEAGRR